MKEILRRLIKKSSIIHEKIKGARYSNLSTKQKFAIYAKYVVLSLIFLLAFVELVFGISIYAFKSDDAFTKKITKIIPFPAVYTSAGSVTFDQYFIEKDYITNFYKSTNQGNVNEADLSKQIVNQLIENQLISAEATKFKVSVSNNEVEEAMSQIYETNGGKEEVKKVLKELYGLSPSQFEDLVKVQLVRDKINRDVVARIEARHILIRVEEGADQAKIDEAKAKADSILVEINNGLDFAEAAKKYSEDVGSAENGGLLESFARGDMVPEFEDAAFETPEGSISAPVKTSFGWHIIKVEKKTGSIDQSFDDWLTLLKERSIIVRLVK